MKVFYTWGESVLKNKFDPGFGKSIKWNIPLLEGYQYCFVNNISDDRGSHHFKGIDNPSLIDEITAWHPDAVLVYGWSFKSHLKALRYFHGKLPVFFRGDSTLLQSKNGISKWIRKFFLRWVYRHVDTAFYVGSANKEYYKEFGLKEHQLVFAPHAVDNERFQNINNSSQQQIAEWKQQLGIQSNELVIIFAGKLEPIKNLESLINAFKNLPIDLPVKLLLVGNGPLEIQLKSIAADNLKIIFQDFQNQEIMPLVYRLGDVYILCSHSETWGLSVNEAMASGRAILIRETCGCAKDLVKNGINGYVFNNFGECLLNHIQSLVLNRSLVEKMGYISTQMIADWNYTEVCKAIENKFKTRNS